jgi:hypothetical protein
MRDVASLALPVSWCYRARSPGGDDELVEQLHVQARTAEADLAAR